VLMLAKLLSGQEMHAASGSFIPLRYRRGGLIVAATKGSLSLGVRATMMGPVQPLQACPV
jgi:hypothetical protein